LKRSSEQATSVPPCRDRQVSDCAQLTQGSVVMVADRVTIGEEFLWGIVTSSEQVGEN
jgi:hypothetical protein